MTTHVRQAVLVVSQRVPTPDFDTASARLELVLETLIEDGHDVTYASTRPEAYGDFTERVAADESRLRSKGITIAIERDVRDHLESQGHRYGTVLASYLEPAYLIRHALATYAPRARTVYDTVDVHHVRLFRTAKITSNAPMLVRALRSKAQEIATIGHYDHTVAVSRDEQELLAELCPEASISVLGCTYPTGVAAPLAARRGTVFVANYLHMPNEDAMVRYTREILPRLATMLGAAPLHRIVGAGTNPVIADLAQPGVEVHGWVPSVQPALDVSRVFVAPLRFGSGIKGKVLEAMAAGIPVVTTSIGAEGLGLRHGYDVLIADTDDDFAAAVALVLDDDDLWHRLSLAALATIEASFSRPVFRDQVRTALTGVHATGAQDQTMRPASVREKHWGPTTSSLGSQDRPSLK